MVLKIKHREGIVCYIIKLSQFWVINTIRKQTWVTQMIHYYHISPHTEEVYLKQLTKSFKQSLKSLV